MKSKEIAEMTTNFVLGNFIIYPGLTENSLIGKRKRAAPDDLSDSEAIGDQRVKCCISRGPVAAVSDRRNVRRSAAMQRIFSAEKPLDQFVTADFKMRSHVIKNSGKRSHFKRIVIRNRDMMLIALADGQPQNDCPFAV